MNQTNNRIRDEWRKKFHNLVGGTIVNKGKLLDTWSPSFTLEEMEDFIDELLKSQRAELVEKIEKKAYCLLDRDGKFVDFEDIISIIKEE